MKLFCFHPNWFEGRPLNKKPHHNDYSYVYGRGFIIPWTCTECGKTKQFTKDNPPIQWKK